MYIYSVHPGQALTHSSLNHEEVEYVHIQCTPRTSIDTLITKSRGGRICTYTVYTQDKHRFVV